MESKKNEFALEAENARLRGDLLTIASRVNHDLRTPLGGMVTGAELLREILAEKNIPDQFTGTILSSVDDMTRLIKQISVVTRATANPLPKTPIQMSEIVDMISQQFESRLMKKGASLVKPDSWPRVNGVPAWLEVIWSNLLMNAVQHAGEKPKVEISWREEKNAYRFAVSDNGDGVPETMRPLLFQPFDTLHRPDSTRGLGLSIVQRLVELQGGACGYEAIPGGASFFFTLPR